LPSEFNHYYPDLIFTPEIHTLADQAGVGYRMYRHWLIGGTVTWRDGDREKRGRILDLEVNGRMLI
jgi:hypothetical protein